MFGVLCKHIYKCSWFEAVYKVSHSVLNAKPAPLEFPNILLWRGGQVFKEEYLFHFSLLVSIEITKLREYLLTASMRWSFCWNCMVSSLFLQETSISLLNIVSITYLMKLIYIKEYFIGVQSNLRTYAENHASAAMSM